MATTQLTLTDNNLLAEYVPLDQFKGVLEQRVAVGPDLLAMLIRDGQIAEAAAGGHFAIGGLWRTLKDAIAGQHAIRLLIADLKPFQLTTSVAALTRDSVPVAGEFTIELQVNPEKGANVLGMMKNHGALLKSNVLERLSPHLFERVVSAAIRRVDALELRGNVELQDKIQADAMKEVERIASDMGMIARVVSVTWAYNEEEQAQVVKRQKEREQEMLEREFQILNRAVQREDESTILRLKSTADVEKAKVTTEDDLRRLILNNELNFEDARQTGVRLQQMKALQHELELNRTQRLDTLKAQLEAEEHLITVARTRLQKQQVDQETQLDADRHQLDRDRVAGERRGLARETETADRTHDVDLERIRGQRRDVEMATATREQEHTLTVKRIQTQIREVDRQTENLDARQRLALTKLERMQELEIARAAQDNNFRNIGTLNQLDREHRAGIADIDTRTADAAHRRAIETAREANQTRLATIEALKSASADQILAINAGFSPEVATVLVEQAKARAAEGADRQAVLREMIQQARDAHVASETQARHFVEQLVRGNVGVAEGVGRAAARPAAPAPGQEGAGTTECPGCHRAIPIRDRFCQYCGRQMRQ